MVIVAFFTWLFSHWLYIHLGINGAGAYYAFWGAAGSDITELFAVGALAAGVGTFMRRYNCEVKGCWRLGRHTTKANHKVCRKHHPDDHLTHEQVIAAHNAAGGSND